MRCFCFFKQKTAYEMRISDWMSDVCSSDLLLGAGIGPALVGDRPHDQRGRGLVQLVEGGIVVLPTAQIAGEGSTVGFTGREMHQPCPGPRAEVDETVADRKITRLNSSH